MSINKIQYQKGYSLYDFLEHYGNEKQCGAALFDGRWSQGFVCIFCSHTTYYHLKKRNLYQCNKNVGKEASVHRKLSDIGQAGMLRSDH